MIGAGAGLVLALPLIVWLILDIVRYMESWSKRPVKILESEEHLRLWLEQSKL